MTRSALPPKDRLTTAILQSLFHDGIGAISLTKICTQARASKRDFYRHFSSLNDAPDAIYSAGASDWKGFVGQEWLSSRSKEALRDVVIRTGTWLDKNRLVARLILGDGVCGSADIIQRRQHALMAARDYTAGCLADIPRDEIHARIAMAHGLLIHWAESTDLVEVTISRVLEALMPALARASPTITTPPNTDATEAPAPYVGPVLGAPQTFADIVFPSANAEDTVRAWLKRSGSRHLFIYGEYGTGKSALANILPMKREEEFPDISRNILLINCRSSEAARQIGSVEGFASMMAQHEECESKYIILNEFDNFPVNSQAQMKMYLEGVYFRSHFIFITNHQKKIYEGIQNRCMQIHWGHAPWERIRDRLSLVARSHGLELSDEDLKQKVYEAGPDWRQMINAMDILASKAATGTA